jgi:hypothetical protein
MAACISGSNPGVVARLKALRAPGESYSGVILRVAKGGFRQAVKSIGSRLCRPPHQPADAAYPN